MGGSKSAPTENHQIRSPVLTPALSIVIVDTYSHECPRIPLHNPSKVGPRTVPPICGHDQGLSGVLKEGSAWRLVLALRLEVMPIPAEKLCEVVMEGEAWEDDAAAALPALPDFKAEDAGRTASYRTPENSNVEPAEYAGWWKLSDSDPAPEASTMCWMSCGIGAKPWCNIYFCKIVDSGACCIRVLWLGPSQDNAPCSSTVLSSFAYSAGHGAAAQSSLGDEGTRFCALQEHHSNASAPDFD